MFEELRYSLDERVRNIKDRPVGAEGHPDWVRIWYNDLWEFRKNHRRRS